MPRLARLMLAGAVGAGMLGFYSFYLEPRWLAVTRTRVPLSRLPAALEGLRIVLLTDLHVGKGTPYRLLRRAVRAAMDARPHLIALTGDFVSVGGADVADVADVLAGLHAPLGVYAVPGNHDHEDGFARWRQALAQHPELIDLTNETVLRRWRGASVLVAGVDDLRTGTPKLSTLAAGAGAGEAAGITLVLAHNPDFAEQLRDAPIPVDLVLSGHTHGGQVRLPFIGPLRSAVERDDLYEAGLVRRPWTQVYVSRGVGTVHLPVRFLTRPEVAVLDLVRAPAAP